MDMYTLAEIARLEAAGYTKRESSVFRLPFWTAPDGTELTHEAALNRLARASGVAQDERGGGQAGQTSN